jgi:hypothetical protein
MRIYNLAGLILIVATTISACGGDGIPIECTIENKEFIPKTFKFAPGTDCEAMRKLAKEGQPLPTLVDPNAVATAPPKPATVQAAFKAPFVSGQKGQDLIPTTDKEARVKELEQKINVDSKQLRDPFTSTIINPVPRLETLLAKPKEQPKVRAAVVVRIAPPKFVAPPPPPPPPDTKAADATIVTGTVEISGKIYAILTAPNEPATQVEAGQLISNGKVLVKRIDINSEPPIVVLQQNGVEVLRAVGAPVVVTTTSNTSPSRSFADIGSSLPPLPENASKEQLEERARFLETLIKASEFQLSGASPVRK